MWCGFSRMIIMDSPGHLIMTLRLRSSVAYVVRWLTFFLHGHRTLTALIMCYPVTIFRRDGWVVFVERYPKLVFHRWSWDMTLSAFSFESVYLTCRKNHLRSPR